MDEIIICVRLHVPYIQNTGDNLRVYAVIMALVARVLRKLILLILSTMPMRDLDSHMASSVLPTCPSRGAIWRRW